ncbi:hypothetical protein C8J57DRAFT_1254356 [Mycena rebaudengoi]|nr:hypothetical protein C8J57DRAFT_1254356 [Mycena rebaudengoi]
MNQAPCGMKYNFAWKAEACEWAQFRVHVRCSGEKLVPGWVRKRCRGGFIFDTESVIGHCRCHYFDGTKAEMLPHQLRPLADLTSAKLASVLIPVGMGQPMSAQPANGASERSEYKEETQTLPALLASTQDRSQKNGGILFCLKIQKLGETVSLGLTVCTEYHGAYDLENLKKVARRLGYKIFMDEWFILHVIDAGYTHESVAATDIHRLLIDYHQTFVLVKREHSEHTSVKEQISTLRKAFEVQIEVLGRHSLHSGAPSAECA